MKCIITGILFIVFSISCFGQKADIPSRKYGNGEPRKEQFRLNKKRLGICQMEFGYNQTHFYSQEYDRYRKAGEIKPESGFRYKLHLTPYPFLLGIEIFQSNYSVSSDPLYMEAEELEYQGTNLTLRYVLFPYSKLSQHVVPTIGVGYQSGILCGVCDKNSLDESENKVAEGVWNVGVLLHLGKTLYVQTEYTQSSTLSDKSLNNFSITLGAKFRSQLYN